jgi:leader peptidase (prepilin peptidase)/N-methyltransferase
MDALTWATVIIAAVAGLVAGRYVVLLIAWVPATTPGWRLPPRHCPHGDPGEPDVAVSRRLTDQRSETGLRATDLLPLSGWRRLRDRCPECGAAAGSWCLPVEVLTAAVFAGLAARFGPSPVLPAFCYLGAVAVALAVIDARHRRLPDVLTLPSYPVALLLLVAAAAATAGGWRHLLVALLGLASAWLLFFGQALIYPAGIGWGDVKLSGLLGLYLGWLGIRALVAGLFLGYLLAAVVGVGLLVTRRASRKSQVPFGPFLLAGTLATIALSGLAGW